MVLTGNAVRERGFHGPSCHLQLHFDLLASLKLLTELTTAVAPVAIAAIWAADGLAGERRDRALERDSHANVIQVARKASPNTGDP